VQSFAWERERPLRVAASVFLILVFIWLVARGAHQLRLQPQWFHLHMQCRDREEEFKRY
jgi:hypothetical protein